MKTLRSIAFVSAICAAAVLLVSPVAAQSTTQTATKRAPAAKPPVPPVTVTPVAAKPVVLPPPSPLPLQASAVEQKCLRAMNGACTNPLAVEQARLRAEIIPAVQVSYLGTPAGTIGGYYITFERLFQDNTLLYGLPTIVTKLPCCTLRSK
jgi:hypothetical protein